MSDRLNTQDLIDLLINRQGFEKKDAENFIKEFFLLIEEGLQKDKVVKIKGLGTFKLVDVESRESVNVNTGERFEIQEHTKISFTPEATLRDIINKPFAHFETVILNDDADFNETPENISEKIDDPIVPAVASVIIEDKPEIVESEEMSTSEIEVADAQEEMEEEQIIETANTVEPVTPRESKEKKDSNKNNVIPLVVILAILICGIIIFLLYRSDIFSGNKTQHPVRLSPLVENVTDSISTDSISADSVATTGKIEKPAATSQGRGGRIPFSQIPVYSDSTSYDIVGTKALHTVRDGETLIRISYRYYGTKDLWPYMLMHNRSIIKDPNYVPIGVALRVPELKKK